MHGSFISFTKPELKTYVLLKTSSEVTSLLWMTVSIILLGTSSEVTFLSGVTVFLVGVACSTRSTCVKGADIEGTSTENADIGAAYTKGTCI